MLYKIQIPKNGDWHTVRSNISADEAEILRQVNIDDGEIEGVDFRIIPQ